jgi:hypothetical protein
MVNSDVQTSETPNAWHDHFCKVIAHGNLMYMDLLKKIAATHPDSFAPLVRRVIDGELTAFYIVRPLSGEIALCFGNNAECFTLWESHGRGTDNENAVDVQKALH